MGYPRRSELAVYDPDVIDPPFFIHDDNKEEYYIRSMTARSQKLTRQSEIMKHLARRFPDWKGR